MLIGKIRPKKSYEVLNDNIDESYNFEVVSRINDLCSLQCPYCHWCHGYHYDLNEWFETHLKLLEVLLPLHKNILFSFHGGEATEHPEYNLFESMIFKLKDKFGSHLTTLLMSHGLSPLSKYEVFDKLNLTLHFNESLRVRKLDNFFLTLETFRNKVVTVDIMLESVEEPNLDLYKDTVCNLIEYCFKYGIKVTLLKDYCHYKDPSIASNKVNQFIVNKYGELGSKFNIDNHVYSYNQLFQLGLNCEGYKCYALRDICYTACNKLFACGVHMTSYLKSVVYNQHCNYYHESLLDLKEVDTSFLKSFFMIYKYKLFKCKWPYCGGDFEVQKVISDL